MSFLNTAGLERLWVHIVKKINDSIKQSDWNQTDSNAIDYIKNKPEAATDEEIIDMMLSIDMMPVVQDADGSILVDSDKAILMI